MFYSIYTVDLIMKIGEVFVAFSDDFFTVLSYD